LAPGFYNEVLRPAIDGTRSLVSDLGQKEFDDEDNNSEDVT
jgi:hypothetical protein